MRRCLFCGGKLKRIHRGLADRLRYLGIWICKDCHQINRYPRSFATHLGPHCMCPLCTTTRVTWLSKPDRIDRMHWGPLNLLERLVGGKLYHCRYCRVQFWDRRPMAADVGAAERDPAEVAGPTNPPDTASSGE